MKKNIFILVLSTILFVFNMETTQSQTYGSWVVPFADGSIKAKELQFGANGINENVLQNLPSEPLYVFGAKVDVKPNPAKDWAAFNFTLQDIDSEGVITISDVSGKLVATLQISGKQGQHVWDCRNIKPGIYIYKAETARFSKHGKLIIK